MKCQLSTVVMNVDSYVTACPQDVGGGSCFQVRRTTVSVLN